MPDTNQIPAQADEKASQVDDLAETLFTPPRRDISFYIVLIVAVIPLWSMVPLSWAFVIYALRTGGIWSYGWRGWAAFAVALVEASLSRVVPLSHPAPHTASRCSSARINSIRQGGLIKALLHPARTSTASCSPRSGAFSSPDLRAFQNMATTRKTSGGQAVRRKTSSRWSSTTRARWISATT